MKTLITSVLIFASILEGAVLRSAPVTRAELVSDSSGFPIANSPILNLQLYQNGIPTTLTAYLLKAALPDSLAHFGLRRDSLVTRFARLSDSLAVAGRIRGSDTISSTIAMRTPIINNLGLALSIGGNVTISKGTNTALTVGNSTSNSTVSSIAMLGKSAGGTALSATWSITTGGVLNLAGVSSSSTPNLLNIGLSNGVFTAGAASAASNSPLFVLAHTRSPAANSHGFVSEQNLTGATGSGHNGYDYRDTYLGSNAYNHTVGFQSAPTYSGSNTNSFYEGFTSALTQTAGTTDSVLHYRVSDLNRSGGTSNVQVGFYIGEELNASTTNWALLFRTAAASSLGGDLLLGTTTTASNARLVVAGGMGLMAAGTTSYPSIRLPSGVAESSCVAGGMYYDGTHFYGCTATGVYTQLDN